MSVWAHVERLIPPANRGGNKRHVEVREVMNGIMYILSTDASGVRSRKICEHGGDPASVAFCHEIALDYVSCSPFRVPIARLAAAQAALGKGPAEA